jgi:integrase
VDGAPGGSARRTAAAPGIGNRDRPDLVAFLMATELRIGEACGLTWDAVDL